MKYEVVGFIDDYLSLLDEFNLGVEVLGAINGHVVDEEFLYLCSIGDPSLRFDVCKSLENNGQFFPPLFIQLQLLKMR